MSTNELFIALLILHLTGVVIAYYTGKSTGTKNALKKRCIGSLQIITEDGTFSDGVMKIDVPYEMMPLNDYASIRIILTEKEGESVYGS